MVVPDQKVAAATLPLKKPATTFNPKPEEREGGERLNLFLAFLNAEVGEGFEAFLINDSNYYAQVVLLSQEGERYALKHTLTIAPNTKELVERFAPDALITWERIVLQAFFYKAEKTFALKPTFSVAQRIDTTKFYKAGSFVVNDFFNDDALILPIIKDDVAVKGIAVNTATLREAMLTQKTRQQTLPARKEQESIQKKGATNELVFDLHASVLLDTVAGMDAKAILDYQLHYFTETLKVHLGKKGARLIFIHGKGNGVLRTEIEKLIKRQFRSCRYQDASFENYGFGALLVIIA